MRSPWVLVCFGAALGACEDDTGNKTFPDTALDEVPAAVSNQGHVRITFRALGNANTFVCRLDSGEASMCISPFEADVQDGEHTFEVAAALNQNVDDTPATHTWRIDTVKPETVLLTTPPALDNATNPAFTFNGSDAGVRAGSVTFECSLDGAGFGPCTSPQAVLVDDGAHMFAVRAKDSAGNVNPTPASHEWSVDTTAPETTITTGPDAGSTSRGSGAFEFTSPEPGATFECAFDGAAFAACTSPKAFTLPSGAHTFAVRAKDAVATIDPSPAQRMWTVDATPPDISITSAPPNPSNDPTPQLAFASTEAGTSFECQVDAGAFAACASPLTSAALADGSHTFRVRAIDGVGNVSPAPASATWVIDTVAPTVSITSAPAALSNDPTPTVAFTTAGAPASVQCQIDAAAFAACTSPFTAAALADGAHMITVRATDAAGNIGTAMAGFTIDTVPPTVTITMAPPALTNDATPTLMFATAGSPVSVQCRVDAGPAASCTSPFTSGTLADGAHSITVLATDAAANTGTASASFTIDATSPTVAITAQPPALTNDPTASVTFTTGGSPTAVECQVDAGAFAACTSPFTSAALADGAHSITVRATDAAGNTGTDSASFTVDATAPTVAITTEPAALSNDNTPSVTFTTGGTPTSTQCRVDGGPLAACTSPFTSAVIADGPHTITVRVADAAGNVATATTASFTIDTVAPTVTLTSQPAALSSDASPTVAFTTAGAPTSTTCQLDAGTPASCTSPFTVTVGDGTHTITVRVADGAGNASSATTAAFVVDTVPPTVSITAQPAALSNDNTPSVQFTTAGSPTSTTCQLDAATPASCTSPFTTTVAEGTHTITIRVVDGAGNASSATTNAFTVDLTAPTVSITSEPAALSSDTTPIVAFTTGGSPTATECRVDAGAFAACTSPFTTTVADGAHTITVRVTDGAGNTASDTTASFVVDTVPPTVSIISQPAALSNDNTPSVSFTTGGSPTSTTCQVDAATPASCTSPFTAAAVADGTHTITVRVVDGAGNASSATTNAFTVDTVAPTVTITSQPAALSNDNTPSVAFTTAGAPTSTTCQVDAGTPASCTSPFTASAVTDGAHTITVRVADGAGNASSATTASFTVDTVAPVLTLTEAPPAAWPVDYFDASFSVSGATTVECDLNGGGFTPCTSPHTFTTLYNLASTLTVRARDGAGNQTTRSATWVSSTGLVLHYPWEQGSTQNTSLLAQVPSHSPDGTAPLPASNIVGGWAGTAITSVASHKYVGTVRPLSSSPDDTYAVSLWVRPSASPTGTSLVNTISAGNVAGFRLAMSGRQLQLTVADGGQLFSGIVVLSSDRWHAIGLRTTGLAKGMQLFADGQLQLTLSVPVGNGFGPQQLANMEVGPFSAIDLDDLRFYNRSFSDAEMCTLLARGTISPASGLCTPLSPGVEFDFEGGVVRSTGFWNLPFAPPQVAPVFVATKTGSGMRLSATNPPWGPTSGLKGQISSAPGRSFSLWVSSSAAGGGIVWDTARQCVVGGPPTLCGIRITMGPSRIDVLVGTTLTNSTTKSIATVPGLNSVVVTERRSGSTSVDVRVFVNGGAPTVFPLGQGDVYELGTDSIALVQQANQLVDEYEVWPTDLAKDPEMLCENGFDGEFDVITGSCNLTSN